MIYGDTHRVIFFLLEGMLLHIIVIIIQHTTSLVSSGVIHCWLHNRPQLITSANVTLAKDQQQQQPPRSTRTQPRLEFCVSLRNNFAEKLTKLLCDRGWSHNFWKPPSGTTSSAVWPLVPKDTTQDDFLCSSKSHNRFNRTVLQFFLPPPPVATITLPTSGDGLLFGGSGSIVPLKFHGLSWLRSSDIIIIICRRSITTT